MNYFTPQTTKPDFSTLLIFKTGQITPGVVLDGGFAFFIYFC